MVTATQVASGIGGGSVGVVASEALIHVADEHTGTIVATLGTGALGLSAAGIMGVGPVPAGAAPGLAGFGIGALTWYLGRHEGALPALSIDVPTEVNVVEPVITAVAVGTVLLAANTVSHVVLS